MNEAKNWAGWIPSLRREDGKDRAEARSSQRRKYLPAISASSAPLREIMDCLRPKLRSGALPGRRYEPCMKIQTLAKILLASSRVSLEPMSNQMPGTGQV